MTETLVVPQAVAAEAAVALLSSRYYRIAWGEGEAGGPSTALVTVQARGPLASAELRGDRTQGPRSPAGGTGPPHGGPGRRRAIPVEGEPSGAGRIPGAGGRPRAAASRPAAGPGRSRRGARRGGRPPRLELPATGRDRGRGRG